MSSSNVLPSASPEKIYQELLPDNFRLSLIGYIEGIPHCHHKDEQYFTKVLSIKLIKGSCVYLGKTLVGYFPVYHPKALQNSQT